MIRKHLVAVLIIPVTFLMAPAIPTRTAFETWYVEKPTHVQWHLMDTSKDAANIPVSIKKYKNHEKLSFTTFFIDKIPDFKWDTDNNLHISTEGQGTKIIKLNNVTKSLVKNRGLTGDKEKLEKPCLRESRKNEDGNGTVGETLASSGCADKGEKVELTVIDQNKTRIFIRHGDNRTRELKVQLNFEIETKKSHNEFQRSLFSVHPRKRRLPKHCTGYDNHECEHDVCCNLTAMDLTAEVFVAVDDSFIKYFCNNYTKALNFIHNSFHHASQHFKLMENHGVNLTIKEKAFRHMVNKTWRTEVLQSAKCVKVVTII